MDNDIERELIEQEFDLYEIEYNGENNEIQKTTVKNAEKGNRFASVITHTFKEQIRSNGVVKHMA